MRPAFHAYRYIEESFPIDGPAMNRFSDWLWSMYADRWAAMSMSAFWGSSQAVRNRVRTSSGRAAMPWTDPSAFLIASRISGVHSPRALSSRVRAPLTCRNSPESVSRLNRLDTCGSMHS